jgi:hypothetical protein
MGDGIRDAASKWLAYNAGLLVLPDKGISYPSAEEAKTAAEKSIPRRGAKPKGNSRFRASLSLSSHDRLTAEAIAAGITLGELLEQILAAHWGSR